MRKIVSAFEHFARRLLINEDGLVAIEFGAVASFLVIMLIGATDLGLAARHRSQMEGAVRAGIQKALKGGTPAAVESAVTAATDLPSDPAPTVTATKVCYDTDDDEVACDSGNVAKMYMEITLEQGHKWLLGMPGFPNPFMLTVINSVRIG